MTFSIKPEPFGKKCRTYGIDPECRRDRESKRYPDPTSDDEYSGCS